ncbi:single-stranded DNA-binding protein [Bifidobacterium sp. DSM 109958]|uniref:Single-stranded DNA-binding protein n=1 Tax=Bifidobacterium moraviense TaxID=2675323 RepID=A0A7Y0F267_9BIFI|nr:single-stranded DNA-binding protein [Bifidobacterium sp. DSM 109958]NMN00628.1 single-stranded DNA-binding protein [Bifidobacterium sp. DSM 109958]
MAGETVITVIGNLTRDPELRSTSRGNVVNFTVASSTRTFDRNTNQWQDGDTLFMNCSAWDTARTSLASNIAGSLSKGMRVIVQGRLTQRSYQAQDGTQRTVVELRVDEVGPALSRATAQVTRQTSQGGFAGRNDGNGFGGNGGFNGGGYNGGQNAGQSSGFGGYSGGASTGFGAAPAQSAPASAPQTGADPWGSSAPAGGSFGSFGGSGDFGGNGDEPEF